MTTLWQKRVALAAWFFVIAAGPGCHSRKPVGSASSSSVTTEVLGAGSAFVDPIMDKWIEVYQQSNPQVRINYRSVGSGAGIQMLKRGLVDFGTTDVPVTDEQLKEMPALVQLPETAGPVCITYNLADMTEPLKLGPEVLAGMYVGKIKKWDDPAIKQDNPGVKLPNSDVVPTHRTENSVTTSIFTTYLDGVSPEWHSKVGKGVGVNWPAGLGGRGSEGITGVIKQTPGSIGYLELTYAAQNSMWVAKLRNAAGNWIDPSPKATSAAIAAFKDQLSKDVRISIVNPPASAPDAYPISGLTYIVIPKPPRDATKGKAVNSFVQYVLNQGQDWAAHMHYAKLPPDLQQLGLQILGQKSGKSSGTGGQ